jgi:hypothetical protein
MPLQARRIGGWVALTVAGLAVAGEEMHTVASAVPLSKSSAYRRAEAVFVKVFARAGLKPSHQLEGAWCVLHIRCCLSAETSQQESLPE